MVNKFCFMGVVSVFARKVYGPGGNDQTGDERGNCFCSSGNFGMWYWLLRGIKSVDYIILLANGGANDFPMLEVFCNGCSLVKAHQYG